MKRGAAVVLALFLLSGCVPQPMGPQPVHQSLYLNKKLVKFVVDNGAPYRSVRLENGRSLHYWRSDFGQLIAIATGRDDSFPDYCEVALETDRDQFIRRIFIIEKSAICNTVLK